MPYDSRNVARDARCSCSDRRPFTELGQGQGRNPRPARGVVRRRPGQSPIRGSSVASLPDTLGCASHPKPGGPRLCRGHGSHRRMAPGVPHGARPERPLLAPQVSVMLSTRRPASERATAEWSAGPVAPGRVRSRYQGHHAAPDHVRPGTKLLRRESGLRGSAMLLAALCSFTLDDAPGIRRFRRIPGRHRAPVLSMLVGPAVPVARRDASPPPLDRDTGLSADREPQVEVRRPEGNSLVRPRRTGARSAAEYDGGSSTAQERRGRRVRTAGSRKRGLEVRDLRGKTMYRSRQARPDVSGPEFDARRTFKPSQTRIVATRRK